AISAQVRQLEQELGTQLFERFGSRISLTTAGRILHDYADQILSLRRQAQDAINELEHNPRGELIIAANEATCIYVLPWVFAEYQRLFPAVQLQVVRSYGARVVEAILENSADFGLAQLPIEEKKLQIVPIFSDEIRLIVAPQHALAVQPAVTPADLTRHPLLLPKSGTTRRRLDIWLETVEDEILVSMELDSTEMTKRFVMAGLGASFLAVSHCREEVAVGRLRAVPLGPEPMMRRLALVYRKDKALSKAALGFIQIVLENAKTEKKKPQVTTK
ncbi:MAG: LysR family transcriptional regulator, partial [Chloroflexi bacterium]